MNPFASAGWQTFTALSADSQFLQPPVFSGRVEQCFDKAVNLVCPQGLQRFTLLSAGSDNAPNSCRLALSTFAGLLQSGDPVYWQGNWLRIGQRMRIDFRTCQTWQPEKLCWKSEALSAFCQQHQGETLATTIYQAIPQNASLFHYCADNIFYRQLAKQLTDARGKLIDGLKHRDKSHSEAAFQQLLGLGIGLTPGGDDYLVGLSAILFINGNPCGQFQDDFSRWLNKYHQQTTPLSALTLNQAIHQRYREVIYLLITKLTLESRGDIQREIQGVMKIGSSSGCDMLYGMADALLLTQYFGGEYVNQDRD
ncbi:DUF2877 domain-containing protein [Atlantibacter subterraneus]|uniref:DUF2877 domain-containing protein n=1 Tax=Atlantibacter subterraneus TaxID=255519 RepID=UPI0029652109|nr:DUF2877 domain-containing protein [Atlantibacter subterranea]MDW2741412.1 DUF2877 domain-containing protein [Atlantibacter subterranea]